jgi:cytoskeletal protein RodZ
VANSNERLNLRALPPPTTLVSGQRRSTGYTHAFEDNPADGFGAGYSPRKPGTIGYNEKYVLKQVMLPSARGSFYMPNFIPTLLVIVIILAAALLIYRGFANQPKDTTTYEEAASATITAGGYAGPYAITPDPTLTSARATFAASDTTSSVMRPPAYYTPDPSIQALDRTPTTGGATAGSTVPGTNTNTTAAAGGNPTQQNQPAPTTAPAAPPAPTATPVPPPPPTATPVPNPITLVVTVSATDTTGSWLTITVDDKQVLARVGNPGESFTYTGNKIAVRAGKPDVIKVTLNGQDVQYTKPNSGLVTHTWFADGHDTVE